MTAACEWVKECEGSRGGEVKTCRVRSRELAEILDLSQEAVGGQVNKGGGGRVENEAMV